MSKKKILIVDDDPTIVELLRVNLEHAGYKIVYTGEGKDALRLANKEKPDLIILDIMLPSISGYEVCHKLREKEPTSYIPILFLSAKDKTSDKITGLELGGDEYMTKPFDIVEMLVRVKSIINRTRQALLLNPLTQLPGSESIMRETVRRLKKKEEFAFVYMDIDHFKAFNDVYGFKKGDEVIKVTARIINQCAREGDFIGHIGGDDFVLICDACNVEDTCAKIMGKFDERIPLYYNIEDRKRGYIAAQDREHNNRTFPIMSLSLGVVSDGIRNHYGNIVEIATEMKNFAKQKKPNHKSFMARDKRGLYESERL